MDKSETYLCMLTKDQQLTSMYNDTNLVKRIKWLKTYQNRFSDCMMVQFHDSLTQSNAQSLLGPYSSAVYQIPFAECPNDFTQMIYYGIPEQMKNDPDQILHYFGLFSPATIAHRNGGFYVVNPTDQLQANRIFTFTHAILNLKYCSNEFDLPIIILKHPNNFDIKSHALTHGIDFNTISLFSEKENQTEIIFPTLGQAQQYLYHILQDFAGSPAINAVKYVSTPTLSNISYKKTTVVQVAYTFPAKLDVFMRYRQFGHGVYDCYIQPNFTNITFFDTASADQCILEDKANCHYITPKTLFLTNLGPLTTEDTVHAYFPLASKVAIWGKPSIPPRSAIVSFCTHQELADALDQPIFAGGMKLWTKFLGCQQAIDLSNKYQEQAKKRGSIIVSTESNDFDFYEMVEFIASNVGPVTHAFRIKKGLLVAFADKGNRHIAINTLSSLQFNGAPVTAVLNQFTYKQ